MEVIKAGKADHLELTDLTIRSKSFWGYGEKQIEEWQEDLTITEKYISSNEVFKLLAENKLVGYYSYFILESKMVKLDNLFIEPTYIGRGYGKFLMTHFIESVKQLEFEKITLDSDPNAEQFYKYFDFVVVGKLESSIENRYLPIMEKIL